MTQCKPNFLIVGAAKSGTTALSNLIQQHPDVYMPDIKEPRYFAGDVLKKMSRKDPQYKFIHNHSIFNKKDYYYLFKDTEEFKSRGERSVHYLFHHRQVIPKIKKELGDSRIIILLRNPARRALSNYYYLQKEILSLKDALEKEKERMASKYNSFWYYRHLGFYYYQIKAYLENFSKVKIIIFNDFKENPAKICRDIFTFLGVDLNCTVNTDIDYNVTQIPKSLFRKFLLKFEHTIIPQKILMPLFGKQLGDYKKTWFVRPDYHKDADIYNKLVDDYYSDIVKVEALMKMDLSHWKRHLSMEDEHHTTKFPP